MVAVVMVHDWLLRPVHRIDDDEHHVNVVFGEPPNLRGRSASCWLSSAGGRKKSNHRARLLPDGRARFAFFSAKAFPDLGCTRGWLDCLAAAASLAFLLLLPMIR